MMYKIVEGNNFPDTPTFEDKVNEAIGQGWEPLGGVTCYTTAKHVKGYMIRPYVRVWFAQAMVLSNE